MAMVARAKSVLRSPSIRSAVAKLCHPQAKMVGPQFPSAVANRSPFRVSTQNPLSISRLPVELSCCVESLLPLHSAIASARLTSMLSDSVAPRCWGWLSKGQDDTR